MHVKDNDTVLSCAALSNCHRLHQCIQRCITHH